jgi:hypothetical protein
VTSSKNDAADEFAYCDSVPYAYLECRENSVHCLKATHRYFKVEGTGADKVYVREKVCDCGTVRTDYFDPHTLDLIGRRYDYPEGYQTEGFRVRGGDVRRHMAAQVERKPKRRLKSAA